MGRGSRGSCGLTQIFLEGISDNPSYPYDPRPIQAPITKGLDPSLSRRTEAFSRQFIAGSGSNNPASGAMNRAGPRLRQISRGIPIADCSLALAPRISDRGFWRSDPSHLPDAYAMRGQSFAP